MSALTQWFQLLDLKGSDAGVSVYADDRVLVSAHAVGESEGGAVRQSDQEVRWVERDVDRKLSPQLEGEAGLGPLLLTPAAPLVGVADHGVLVSMGVEARVHVHGDVRLIWADVHRKI